MTPSEPISILDVAGGTGDIGFRCIEELQRCGARPSVFDDDDDCRHRVVLCDINQAMLDVGMERARQLHYIGDQKTVRAVDVEFLCADAQNLVTIADDSIDIYTIAFGLRNVTDKEAALREANRVLRRGGRLMILEFSSVDVPVLRELYDFWSFNAIPTLGALIANDRPSYQYLVESIRKFPRQEELCEMMRSTSFDKVTFENLSGGIVAIHSGYKL